MTQAIGFANKFYTLWTIRKDDNFFQDAYGNARCVGSTIHYTYHKNISTDINKVKELFPNLEVYEDLHGKSNSWSERKEDNNAFQNIMRNGKYTGHDLNLLVETDFDYVVWVATNLSNANAKYAKEIPSVKSYLSQIEQARIENINFNMDLSHGLSADGFIEFEATSNLKVSSEYSYYTLEVEGVNITFYIPCSMHKEMYYNGFSYGLPLIDGKAKKMKGKRVRFEFTKSCEGMEHAFSNEDLFHFQVTKIQIL